MHSDDLWLAVSLDGLLEVATGGGLVATGSK
jgi:hypothetical protein